MIIHQPFAALSSFQEIWVKNKRTSAHNIFIILVIIYNNCINSFLTFVRRYRQCINRFDMKRGFSPQSKDNVIVHLTVSEAKAWHPLSQHRQVPSKCQTLAWVLVIFKEDHVYTISIYDKQVFVIRSTHNNKANTYKLCTTQLSLWCGVPMK